MVALINTLHRFSESLAAVNDFRKLWAAADAQDEERMIEAAASAAQPPRVRLVDQLFSRGSCGADVSPFARAVFSQSLHSPVAGKDTAPDTFLADLLVWLQACRDGTVGCVRGLVEGLWDVLDRVVSLFKMSGKEQGPRSDL